MKKLVLKLDLHDDKAKQKAMKAVSSLTGIDSIHMDMKEKKLTLTGDVDPVCVVRKLRKNWPTEVISLGPAKGPEKTEEPKKDPPKKVEPKKDEKKKDPSEQMAELLSAYKAYNPHMTAHYYVHCVEENPNACVIC